MARTVDPALVEHVTKELADQGKLIEAGWAGYRLMVIPHEAPQIQIDECRLAFFAGAQHLFSSIMNMLDPDGEPTDADVKKMDLIHTELQRFAAVFEARTKTNQ
jgi:hypothetical protein